MVEELTFTLPEQALAPWVVAFVHRRNGRAGDVVFELPELRPSIQIMLGDDYWLREREDPEGWRPVPRVALWGPRLNWGYGYARSVIHAFGIGLTPDAVFALTGQTASAFVDRVVDLSAFQRDFARELGLLVAADTAERSRAVASAFFERLPPLGGDKLGASLDLLRGEDQVPMRWASDAAGVGDRHFRRVFRSRYGFSPRQYRRVLRVDRLLRRLHPKPWEPDYLPSEPDFADQPHMIREFKALTGVTPGAYARAKRGRGDATLRSVFAEGVPPPE